MRYVSLQARFNRTLIIAMALCFLGAGAGEIRAQSTNPDAPSPVRANTIAGQIAPLDVGDARLTRHFYRFSGLQGDLVITIESQNLNGGIDLFTLNGLRPLTQIVLYSAGQTTTRASKSIYLRGAEEIVLRVEARSPNDDPGSYRIKFEGAFEVAKGNEAGDSAAERAEAPDTTAEAGRRNTRRVSSVGARIETRETARSDAATTAPTAEPSATTDTPAVATPPTETPAPMVEPSPVSPRTRRGRATSTRVRRRPVRPSSIASRRAPTRRAPAAAPASARINAPTASLSQPALSPRLIIETRDGARVERSMSSVRRVTVDNNQLVIILNNGKVERQAMTNVLRFSIEP